MGVGAVKNNIENTVACAMFGHSSPTQFMYCYNSLSLEYYAFLIGTGQITAVGCMCLKILVRSREPFLSKFIYFCSVS